MYSGFYTLASGILTRQNEIDVLGNNITNVKTPVPGGVGVVANMAIMRRHCNG